MKKKRWLRFLSFLLVLILISQNMYLHYAWGAESGPSAWNEDLDLFLPGDSMEEDISGQSYAEGVQTGAGSLEEDFWDSLYDSIPKDEIPTGEEAWDSSLEDSFLSPREGSLLEDDSLSQAEENTFSPEILVEASGGEIYSVQDFLEIYEHPEESYQLMRNINLSGVTLPQYVTFDGSLNGNGNVIYGLSGPAGLFGTLNGNVQNLTLADVDIQASASMNSSIGAIASYVAGTITDTKVSGKITVTQGSQDWQAIGGIAGNVFSGAYLEKCVSEVDLDVHTAGNNSNIGGVVGFLDNGFLSSCRYRGNIKVTQSQTANEFISVSGIASINYSTTEDCLLDNSTSGSIDVQVKNGYTVVSGIAGGTDSVNRAGITIKSEGGHVLCAGARQGTKLYNEGSISVTLAKNAGDDESSVSGLFEVSEGYNTGSIDVKTKARVSVAGVWGKFRCRKPRDHICRSTGIRSNCLCERSLSRKKQL